MKLHSIFNPFHPIWSVCFFSCNHHHQRINSLYIEFWEFITVTLKSSAKVNIPSHVYVSLTTLLSSGIESRQTSDFWSFCIELIESLDVERPRINYSCCNHGTFQYIYYSWKLVNWNWLPILKSQINDLAKLQEFLVMDFFIISSYYANLQYLFRVYKKHSWTEIKIISNHNLV
jgi:hypothetical protein